MMGVPIQDILFTVFQSIFEVFLLCLAGFTLSAKGIVDKPTSKALNHINIALFTPSLLFSKVAFFLTPAKLRQLWVIPIFFVVVTGLSAVVAHCLARACRLKRSQVNYATAASMFMNSNSLPVAIMQSLATTVPILKWGPDDTIDAMFGRSLTYLVVFSTLGMMLRWSYGIRLLSQANEPESIPPPPATYRDIDDTDQHPALTRVSVQPTGPLVDYETEADIEARDRHVWRTHPLRSRLPHPRLTRYHAHPHLHSHLPAVPTSLGDQSESDDTDELETTEGDGDSEDTIALRSQIDTGSSTEAEDHASEPPSAPLVSSSSERTPRWVRATLPSPIRLLNAITSLSPPLVASFSALFCVLVPPFQRLIKSQEMIPFKGALGSAGACSIPLTLLVLGGWFWDEDSTSKMKHNGETSTVSDGQGNAKSQAKGRYHATQHAPQSHNSSTASLSSMIGAFGDVLMAHIHLRRGSARTSRRVRGGVNESVGANDVEFGPQLATHTEIEVEDAENSIGVGRVSQSRSRSRTDSASRQARPSPINTTTSPASTNPPGETLTVVITLLARMVIAPLIITPMIVLVSRLGWGGEVFEDPVFIVSSMLLISSPPALTLAQISQRAKKPPTGTTAGASAAADTTHATPFERLLSRTVFWSYLVLTPPITIMSVMTGLLLIES
ncbi:membrane transport protein-domain-containing protein [Boletus reticuloceps]|uniref:Membrane transport protein-domain-containing protein n=1 Tax=Boletus reticuloceps TaxID=495285 RepID=A0A8I2YCN9_9AGAM|nr:membrane transport protein-domain-containing protein [Boletus reticuloceps]KAG6377277.1 membrane transport protein-domain-containing protein [Boletus reticuloceps]